MNRLGPRGCRAFFAAMGLLTSICAFLPPPWRSSRRRLPRRRPRPRRRPGRNGRSRFVLPFGAGTATDVAARLMSEKLAARWGKPIVIENRPGADGLLAINAFVSANDDHVLLYASTASFIAHPYMLEKMPYNLERDLRRSRASPTPSSPRACRRR